MTIRVSKVDIWSGNLPDQPGGLDRILGDLAAAGANLECVIGRRHPQLPGHGHVYLTPVKGRKAQQAATAAGLHLATNVGTLRVEMPNKPGTAHVVLQAIADASINVRGFTALAQGAKALAYIGLDSPADAVKAAAAIKAATKGKR